MLNDDPNAALNALALVLAVAFLVAWFALAGLAMLAAVLVP